MSVVDLVEFPDAEAVVQAVLLDGLPDYGRGDTAVKTKTPNPRPEEFYVVRRTGGPWRDIVTDVPTIVVESWAQDKPTAAAMAQLARGLLHLASGTVVDGVAIYKVDEFSGPGDLPDPLSGQPRYVQTFAVAMRGEAVLPGS